MKDDKKISTNDIKYLDAFFKDKNIFDLKKFMFLYI